MTKTNLAEYLRRMSKPLGHHSWWYTNRPPAECVNVKVHASPDTDEVLATLTPKQREAVNILGLDIEELLTEAMWEMISDAARDLAEDVRELVPAPEHGHTVASVDYGGNSGGWAALVFSFSDAVDIFIEDGGEIPEYMKKEEKEIMRHVASAEKYIADCEEMVRKLHKSLRAAVADPTNYTEAVIEHIEGAIELRKARAQRDVEALAALAGIN